MDLNKKDSVSQIPKLINKFSIKPWQLILFFSILVLVISLFYIKLNNSKIQIIDLPKKISDLIKSDTKLQPSWVNYPNIADFRDIVIDGDTMWLATNGSLVEINLSQKKVIKTYSMTDGLIGNTITSLVKQGQNLWVGQQGGVSKLNLDTDIIQSYSVSEGLVNGSNIGLTLSGNNLWIGTFDGVSKYNPDKDNFINYKSELGSFATKWTVNEKLISDNQEVWFIINANANSQGGVAVYNNANNNWTTYNSADITGETGGRIDLMKPALSPNYFWVYGGTSGIQTIYQFDRNSKKWKTLTSVSDQIKKENPNSGVDSVIGYKSPYLYLSAGNTSIYKYNPENGQLEQIFIKANADNQQYYKLITMSDNRIYYEASDGIYYFDVDTQQLVNLNIKGIPSSNEQILAVINKYLLIPKDDKLQLFDTETGSFKLLKGIKYNAPGMMSGTAIATDIQHNRLYLLDPYLKRGEVQCNKAQLIQYDLNSQKKQSISIPDIENSGQCGLSLDNMADKVFNNQLLFTTNEYLYIFNLSTRQMQKVDKKISYLTNFGISTKYGFWYADDQSIGFVKDGNIQNIINNFPANTLQIKEVVFADKNYYANVSSSVAGAINLYQINCPSGPDDCQWQKMDYPIGPAKYSPFPDWNKNPVVNDITYDENNQDLWVAHSRGLSVYHQTTKIWQLYTAKDGLIGNVINKAELVNSKPWVIVNWGGLSGLK